MVRRLVYLFHILLSVSLVKKLYKIIDDGILVTQTSFLGRNMFNRKLEKDNIMYLIDLARVQLPPNELNAAVARRDEKVARLKEQMGNKYRLHPDNIVRLPRNIPNFLLKGDEDD